MNVIRLSIGEDEPEGEDYVKLAALPHGTFRYDGTVGFYAAEAPAGRDTDNGAAIIWGDGFRDEAAAEAAAIADAASRGCTTLYVLPSET